MSIIRNVTLDAMKKLDDNRALIFIGPRQAGKTTILHQIENALREKQARSYFMTLEDPEYLDLLNKSPKNIFKIFNFDSKARTYLFIDEIQYLDNPANFLKYLYDEYAPKIKLIVSGSSAFYIDTKFRDSLAGRKIIYDVRTLSFREFLTFKGRGELAAMDFSKLGISEREVIQIEYREYVVFGGYPRVVLEKLEDKVPALQDLAYSYIKKDIFDAHIRQDEVFYKLFKILASQVGALVNASELASTLGVSKTMIDHYLQVMRKSFHINFVPPFFKNVRKELTRMPKVYFGDLGLRNFFVNDFRPFETRNDKGAILENACYRQLADSVGGDDIKYWRTAQKQEVDFIVPPTKAYEVKASPARFSGKNYRVFMDAYPDMEFTVVTLGAEDKAAGFSVKEVWEL